LALENIHLLIGNIIDSNHDVIVNAANPIMLGGGGVDGVIHKAAGRSLFEACKKIKLINGVRCPTGEARITSAGELNAKFVIHTVGPRFNIDLNPEKLLISAYQKSLDLALKYNNKSISFPAISCGVYGYPVSEAAHIALLECSDVKYNKLDIYFYLFSNRDYAEWNKVYSMLSKS